MGRQSLRGPLVALKGGCGLVLGIADGAGMACGRLLSMDQREQIANDWFVCAVCCLLHKGSAGGTLQNCLVTLLSVSDVTTTVL